MSLINLFVVQAQERICFGPFCPDISKAVTGSGGNVNILAAVGATIGKLINLLVITAGLLMLLYLLWGALDWITSAGEKEKLEKAQQKIQHAVIGMILVIVVLTLYGLIAGDILGIIVKNPDGSWALKIPLLTQ